MKKTQAYKITWNRYIYNEESLSMYYLLVEHTRQDKLDGPTREKGRLSEYGKLQKSKCGSAKICICAIRYFCNWQFLQKCLCATGKLKICVSNQTQCLFMLNSN